MVLLASAMGFTGASARAAGEAVTDRVASKQSAPDGNAPKVIAVPRSAATGLSAGPVGLTGSAAMGLSVGLLAAAAALYAVRENPELRDDFRPIAQPITGVLATASAVSLFVVGATMLALDVLWLSTLDGEAPSEPSVEAAHKM